MHEVDIERAICGSKPTSTLDHTPARDNFRAWMANRYPDFTPGMVDAVIAYSDNADAVMEYAEQLPRNQREDGWPEREIDFDNQDKLDYDRAVAVSKAIGGDIKFALVELARFSDKIEYVRICREGSDCMYAKIKEPNLKAKIDFAFAAGKSGEADEVSYDEQTGEFRLWWD